MQFKSFLSAAAAALALAGASALATPVQVGISGAMFEPGAGYGIEAPGVESASPTLLDVRFDASAFAAQDFTLSTVGTSHSFTMGTVQLAEQDIHANERDNLTVRAFLNFTNPVGELFSLEARGTAYVGRVDDATFDYFLHWDRSELFFGDGGFLQIELGDMMFGGAETLTQTVTVTYIQAPVASADSTNQVPEPASLGLLGLGLVGLWLGRRRRA